MLTPWLLPNPRPLSAAASTVFVRGVDISNATEITLRRLFSSCGEVVHVKIVAARACAFVMYGDKAAAAKAVSSLDGRLVGNSKIRVAVRVPVKRQSHAPAPKVCVCVRACVRCVFRLGPFPYPG